ncbi:MAG TPA: 4Fe-4S dicluster domain-containing protein [Firmicutes bacterium]|nr:4Fe-4S dicluster domain-containing protein [Bacillota bacterium]
MPTRTIYWNISGYLWLYLFLAIAAAILAYGLWGHYRVWCQGIRNWPHGQGWRRLGTVLRYGLAQRRFWSDVYASLQHLFVMGGMLVLLFGTAIVLLEADFHLPVFRGRFYLWLSLALDIFGALAVVGLIMALGRRYLVRPARLDNRGEDALILGGLLFILLNGFALEALRVAAAGDPWRAWSPVGSLFALPLAGVPESTLLWWHRVLWWVHLLTAMGMVAWLPFSRLLHVVTAPLHQFLRDLGPAGVPSVIDFEDESRETYGLSRLEEVGSRERLSFDACTRCGRCQDVCPAHLSGKPLTPKQLVLDLRTQMHSLLPWVAQPRASPSTLPGGVVGGDVIWSCTTCGACQEQCPVFVQHPPLLQEMRRYLVMMEGDFPGEAQLALRNIETNYNPWGVGWADRTRWTEGLEVPAFPSPAAREPSWLFWVGCAGSFDARNRKVAAAVVSLLQKAGVPFGILGTNERCCGDPARRLGNEYLFQSLAQHNIAALRAAGVERIITACPHCYHVLSKEYPALGGTFQVYHHTQLLARLLEEKRLAILPVTGGAPCKVVYHDSCYLGRYAGIYAEPRRLLELIPGFKRVEMERRGSRSFCCGGGGGRAWMEESQGERINLMRTDQAVATGAEMVATACPFCLTMLEDGSKERGQPFQVLDVAEILASHVSSRR